MINPMSEQLRTEMALLITAAVMLAGSFAVVASGPPVTPVAEDVSEAIVIVAQSAPFENCPEPFAG